MSAFILNKVFGFGVAAGLLLGLAIHTIIPAETHCVQASNNPPLVNNLDGKAY